MNYPLVSTPIMSRHHDGKLPRSALELNRTRFPLTNYFPTEFFHTLRPSFFSAASRVLILVMTSVYRASFTTLVLPTFPHFHTTNSQLSSPNQQIQSKTPSAEPKADKSPS